MACYCAARQRSTRLVCCRESPTIVAMLFRVQLICQTDDDAAAIRGMLPNELHFEAPLLATTSVELEYDELILAGSWAVDFTTNRFDLGIFAMSAGSTPQFMARSGVMRDNVGGIVFISEDGRPPPTWTMRHRRDSIVPRPISEHVLRAALERAVIESHRIYADAVDENDTLNFITHLVEKNQRVIEPVLAVEQPNGFYYPIVQESFGPLLDAASYCEHLSSLGLVKKTVADRLRFCPVCNSTRLIYREGCPRCGSSDFQPFDAIHHITCGFTGDRRAFIRGAALVCPSCNRTLEQEGRDFSRPEEGLRCNSCAHTFPRPEVIAHCQHCGNNGQPEETEELLIFRYELLPHADEASLIRRLGVADIIGTIRSEQTGLFTRQYFRI